MPKQQKMTNRKKWLSDCDAAKLVGVNLDDWCRATAGSWMSKSPGDTLKEHTINLANVFLSHRKLEFTVVDMKNSPDEADVKWIIDSAS